MRKFLLPLITFTFVSLPSFAEKLTLPFLISDNMVVQRNKPIPIWGESEAHQIITLTLVSKQSHETMAVSANSDGQWQTAFSPKKAGGPYVLTLQTGDSKTEVSNIWVGDVWVLSGQSNMEWTLAFSDKADTEIPNANDALIRHFKVPRSWSPLPSTHLAGGEWKTANPKTVGEFSGVGYFFAKHIRGNIDVPIGLLHSSWGGSNIESWMDAPLLGLDPNDSAKQLLELAEKEAVEQKAVEEKVSQWPNALTEKPFNAEANWNTHALDESDWVDIKTPSLWENQGFNGLDGVAWYRYSFQLNEAESKQQATLNLARIDDNDITWLNGKRVGSTNAYSQIRTYPLKSNVLREGKNTIAIRVEDTGGGGGIYSDPALLSLKLGENEKSLAGNWKFKVDKGSVLVTGNKNHTPTALYNKMMHPLFNIPVKGVLWYQGESNANEAEQAFVYRDQFKSLITDWRTKWNDESLPFYWVQLANFNSGRNTEEQSPWAIVRESQTETLSLKNTGQVITIDVGDPNDIHPTDKETVGKRLGYIALAKTYKQKAVEHRGPHYHKHKIKGSKVIVSMNSKSKLTSNGNTISGFELQDLHRKWHKASAKLKGNKIEVSSKSVITPVAVRYAWNDNPSQANLRNKAGLPAEPFRTHQYAVF